MGRDHLPARNPGGQRFCQPVPREDLPIPLVRFDQFPGGAAHTRIAQRARATPVRLGNRARPQ